MPEQIYQVIIVGAGPGGLRAAARGQANQIDHLLIDKGELGNTLYEDYQYGKFVQAFPSTIPVRSDLFFQAGSREEILAGWNTYTNEHHLNVHKQEYVTAVTQQDGSFEVRTAAAAYRASNVIIAIGKLGNPRHLTIPGAELTHVEYRLKDPRAYTDKDILVVGSGDSAAEVALALAERNRVTIFTRRTGFFRMNEALQSQVNQKIESKELNAYFNATLERIEPDAAYLLIGDHHVPVKAQHIFVKIGAEMPRRFLEQCGVTFASKDPEALPILDAKYQTVVPGLFLVGSVGGKDL